MEKDTQFFLIKIFSIFKKSNLWTMIKIFFFKDYLFKEERILLTSFLLLNCDIFLGTVILTLNSTAKKYWYLARKKYL